MIQEPQCRYSHHDPSEAGPRAAAGTGKAKVTIARSNETTIIAASVPQTTFCILSRPTIFVTSLKWVISSRLDLHPLHFAISLTSFHRSPAPTNASSCSREPANLALTTIPAPSIT